MAGKPVDLTKPPLDAKQKQALMDRVTGARKEVIPPALKLPPGVKGAPPIPVGKVRVGAAAGPQLTEAERAAMEAVGWKEGQPIPANMAQIFAEMRAQQAQAVEYVPPIDPATPPLDVKITDESELDPAARAEIRRKMDEALAQQKAAAEQARRQAQNAALPPEVQQAVRLAGAHSPPAYFEAEDDRASEPVPAALKRATPTTPALPATPTTPALPATSTTPALPATPPAEAEPVQTIAGDTLTNCPHCSWDLSQPDVAEPDLRDRSAFLQALLGEKPFVKTYKLFGGRVVMTLRTLTGGETDAIFSQVHHEERRGKIDNALDSQERKQRFRLYLQLVSLQSDTFNHILPSGFTPVTNPYADSHWQLPELEPGDVGLGLVEEHVTQNVIRTEPLHRVLRMTCNQFNRLVARMEALVHNPDFWNETDTQPS